MVKVSGDLALRTYSRLAFSRVPAASPPIPQHRCTPSSSPSAPPALLPSRAPLRRIPCTRSRGLASSTPNFEAQLIPSPSKVTSQCHMQPRMCAMYVMYTSIVMRLITLGLILLGRSSSPATFCSVVSARHERPARPVRSTHSTHVQRRCGTGRSVSHRQQGSKESKCESEGSNFAAPRGRPAECEVWVDGSRQKRGVRWKVAHIYNNSGV